MVPVAGWQAQRAWGVQAVKGEVEEARLQLPDQAVPVELLTTPTTGLANIATLLISSRPPSARLVIIADKSVFLHTLTTLVGLAFRLCWLIVVENYS